MTNKNYINLILLSIVSMALGFLLGKYILNKPSIDHNMTNMQEHTQGEAMHSHNDAHLHVKANFPEPTVKVEAFKDTMGGYNIKTTTTNFNWVPEKAGQNVDSFASTEGHAHVFVNGKKFGRLYGEWMYLKGEYFQKGENEIVITLNGNNHMDWYNTNDTKQMKASVKVIVE